MKLEDVLIPAVENMLKLGEVKLTRSLNFGHSSTYKVTRH